MSKKRISWLDMSRGISIIFVVSLHSILPHLKEQYGYFVVFEILLVLSMSALIFVSGWAFELGVKKYESNKLKSIGNKFMRLMIPYFVFSIIYYTIIFVATKIPALSSIASMGSTDFSNVSLTNSILQILTYQGSMCKSLWFLYTLFIYNILHILFPKVMKHPVTIVLLFCMPFLQYAMGDSLPTLISKICTYPGYFSLGRVAVSFSDKIFAKNKLRFSLVSIFFAVSAIILYSFYFHGAFDGNMKYFFVPLKLIVGSAGLYTICVGCIFLENTKIGKFLTYCGKNSMAIYLIHFPFITQVSTAMILKLLPTVPSILACLTGTVLGIVIPLLASEFIITRVPLLNTILLGAPLKKRA